MQKRTDYREGMSGVLKLLIPKSLPAGQKPIEGSNPSLSAIEKSQEKQDPAGELGAKEKAGCFLLPAYCQLCRDSGSFISLATLRHDS